MVRIESTNIASKPNPKKAEMDTKWRERVLEVYGQREEDFASSEEYNDYVEKREDLSESVWFCLIGIVCVTPAVPLIPSFPPNQSNRQSTRSPTGSSSPRRR